MPEPVIYSVDDVNDADAETLRQKFLHRVQQDDLKELVDPVDVRRAKTDALWCKRFLAHGDLDMEKSLAYMIDSVKFRKEMGCNAMTLDSINRELFSKGVMCTHGRDKAGCTVVIFNARFHERASSAKLEEVKKFLVYWIEMIERKELGRRITMFFDMGNAGLSNVDIPFISYLINLFKLYYPDMLNAIIVFELPFIMNAAWKIVKNMLPAKSHQLIKFASKKDVSTHIPGESCLVRWGGSDTWEYKFDPEECLMPPSPFLGDQPTPSSTPAGEETDQLGDEVKVNGDVAGESRVVRRSRKGRTAAARAHEPVSKFHSMMESPTTSESPHKVHFGDEDSQTSGELVENKLIDDGRPSEIGGLLEISPGEEVWFGSGSSGATRTLTLVNIRGAPVAFKVKTTSPEKFRVRPSSGVVGTGRRQQVELALCDGVSPQHVITDRFLVVAAGVPHERVPARDMGRLWRSLPSEDKVEHCLRCAAAPSLNDPMVAVVRGLGARLETLAARLDTQQRGLEAAAQQQQRGRRLLAALLTALTLLATANLYLTLSANRC